ncbi:MAG: NUDIX hydrolase [Demequinaceae bacterium]|nr:NUDIX hydrolase [Demequinaceae bacterium]
MKIFATDAVLAAGALVWREREGQLEVLAVHRPRYDDWSWPKGKLDPGETMPACAVREVAEETRVTVDLGIPLPTLRYPIAGGKIKVVRYWAAQETAPDAPAASAREPVKAATKHEIDEIAWLTIDQARERITFHDDLRPLERLVEEHEAGRLRTRVFIVARHARAQRRKAWLGADERRPLTSGGAARALQLKDLFAAFGTVRIVSSAAVRCVQTVLPYAQAAGLPVRGYESLTEESHRKHPDATAATYASLLGKRRSRVVCVHRPTLPVMVALLRARITGKTRGALPRTMPFLPAGGVLVAHVIDHEGHPRIVAVETHLLKPTL